MPFTSTFPLVGVKIPVIIFIVVDFPAPFEPIYPTTSPSSISKFILSTALVTVYSVENKDFIAPLNPGYFLFVLNSLVKLHTLIKISTPILAG